VVIGFFIRKAFDRADFNPDDADRVLGHDEQQDWHVCELSQQGIVSASV
jgi:hypothetical protein